MKRSAWSVPTSTGYRRNHSLSIGCFFLCSGALHLSGIVDTMEVMNDRGGMTAAAAVRQIVEKGLQVKGRDLVKKTVAIGKQSFAALRENDYFYIDKTDFS